MKQESPGFSHGECQLKNGRVIGEPIGYVI